MKIIINKSSKINSPYIYKGLFIFLVGLIPTIIPSVAWSQNAENLLLNEDVTSDNSKDENDSSTEKDKEIPTIIVTSSGSIVSKGIVSRPVAFSNEHKIFISFKFILSC